MGSTFKVKELWKEVNSLHGTRKDERDGKDLLGDPTASES